MSIYCKMIIRYFCVDASASSNGDLDLFFFFVFITKFLPLATYYFGKHGALK